MDEDAASVETGRADVRLDLTESRTFAVEGDGTFAIGPGQVDLDFELFFARRDLEEGMDVVGIRLRARDPEGRRWIAEGTCSPWIFGKAALEERPPVPVRFEEAAPASWRRALRERPILEGISDLWDDRAHCELDTGERRYEVVTKYLGPTLDLAFLPGHGSDPRLAVRLSGREGRAPALRRFRGRRLPARAAGGRLRGRRLRGARGPGRRSAGGRAGRARTRRRPQPAHRSRGLDAAPLRRRRRRGRRRPRIARRRRRLERRRRRRLDVPARRAGPGADRSRQETRRC